jgi:hypothetical protein
MYYDDSHLSERGARYLAPMFAKIFVGPAFVDEKIIGTVESGNSAK